MTQPTFGFALPALCTAFLLLTGCASAGERGPSTGSGSAQPVESCFAVGDAEAREACFARMPREELAACKRDRPLACAPYADMHRQNARLAEIRAALSAALKRSYASYEEIDPGYLADMQSGLSKREAAWTSWRDALCELQPYLDGRSRAEIPDLTEACRLEMTAAHVKKLDDELTSLKEEDAR